MSTILDTIIANKRKEIEFFKAKSSVERFEKEGFFWNFTNRSLKESLLKPGSTGIIAEFKRKSPSKGWFTSPELEVEPVVAPYNHHGAAGLSVLTDREFFGGDLDDLIQTKVITDIPVLRKDFMIDPWQIAEAKAFGADVILLIAACLTPAAVQSMAAYARSIGLEVLLELHEESELGHICDETDIIGINNRDLKTFKVDIERSLRMAERIPAGKVKVAESGISSIQNIQLFRQHGFSGFLIGEHFMKEPNPGDAFKGFVEELGKASQLN